MEKPFHCMDLWYGHIVPNALRLLLDTTRTYQTEHPTYIKKKPKDLGTRITRKDV